MKANSFKREKERSRRYPAQTITDADCTDDIALLANSPAQAQAQLYSLERAAGGIGLPVNTDETEYMMWFNRSGDISTLKCGPLKLVEKFTYLESNVSSTENDINTWLAKAWTTMIGYWSYGSQTCFFQAAVIPILLYVLYFDPRPGPKMLFQGDTPEGSDTFQWPVIERDRVGGLRLMIWDKVKVPLCHYSDAPEESNLWTAWELFPLDDD